RVSWLLPRPAPRIVFRPLKHRLPAALTIAGSLGKRRSARGMISGESAAMRFAYILIKTERGRVREVAEQLIELEEVSEVHSISGRHDLIAKIMVPTYDDLGATIPDKVHHVQGIRETETCIVFNVFK